LELAEHIDQMGGLFSQALLRLPLLVEAVQRRASNVTVVSDHFPALPPMIATSSARRRCLSPTLVEIKVQDRP